MVLVDLFPCDVSGSTSCSRVSTPTSVPVGVCSSECVSCSVTVSVWERAGTGVCCRGVSILAERTGTDPSGSVEVAESTVVISIQFYRAHRNLQ